MKEIFHFLVYYLLCYPLQTGKINVTRSKTVSDRGKNVCLPILMNFMVEKTNFCYSRQKSEQKKRPK